MLISWPAGRSTTAATRLASRARSLCNSPTYQPEPVTVVCALRWRTWYDSPPRAAASQSLSKPRLRRSSPDWPGTSRPRTPLQTVPQHRLRYPDPPIWRSDRWYGRQSWSLGYRGGSRLDLPVGTPLLADT